MSMSSSTMGVAKLALAWIFIAGAAAIAVNHLDGITSTVGVVASSELREDAGREPARRIASAEPAPRQTATSGRSVEIQAGDGGHFHARARVNGSLVETLVDTGATMVALTYEDATAAGIHVTDSDFKYRVQTANGVSRVAMVMLDTVSIEDIEVRNVRAAVVEPGKLATTLLGMSFLGQLTRAEMRRGTLVLQE